MLIQRLVVVMVMVKWDESSRFQVLLLLWLEEGLGRRGGEKEVVSPSWICHKFVLNVCVFNVLLPPACCLLLWIHLCQNLKKIGENK